MAARIIVFALVLLSTTDALRGKGRGKSKGRGSGASTVAVSPPGEVECTKCMSAVMRLLIPHESRGCPGMPNGTVITSTDLRRVPTAYCPTLLPKKRACIAYSFGADGSSDFDNQMVAATCRVLSFDPLCCGAAHRVGPSHDFIPIGLHWFDGLTDSDDPTHPNTTFPVLTLNTIKTSYEHPKVDVLRLKVATKHEWKVLKNLVNTGALTDIFQVSLNLRMEDHDMWEEYRTVLNGVRAAGFFPFYVKPQAGSTYLKVQEGKHMLYSAYEVAYGNDS